MGLAGLVAFSGGAGFQATSSLLAGVALVTALFWQPSPALSVRLEKVWGALAVALVVRAVALWFLQGGDVVIPVDDVSRMHCEMG